MPRTERKVEVTDSGTGSSNAASLSGSNAVKPGAVTAFHWDTSGSATLTIEAFVDGSWETVQSKSISAADDGIEAHELPYTELRAYLDQARNAVVATGVGLQ